MSNAPSAYQEQTNPLVNLTIDGRAVSVSAGTTILQAARQLGIHIPTLCYLKEVSDIASCRICVVEVAGQPALMPACATLVADGMAVTTNSERVVQARKMALQLILAEHGLNTTNFCFSCKKNGSCELQDVARDLGVADIPFGRATTQKPIYDSNPFISFNPNLCIKCQRCVGACNRQAHNHTLHTGKKGLRTMILQPFGENWRATECESCGCCAQACPTGALTLKRRDGYRSWEVRRTLTTCPHCAVGCQFYLVTKGNQIVDVEPADGASNKGMLCVKGRSGSFDFVSSPERLNTPLIKNPETGEFEPADWDTALDYVAAKMGAIKAREGGDALAAFACSRSTNEDVYMLQKMARTAFGTNNVDNCARV